MKKKITLFLIFVSSLTLIKFVKESKDKDFCKKLESEVSKNLFNRNKKFIPSWIKPFINEEILIRDVVSKTLMEEVKIKDNIIFSQGKCLFLFNLERLGDEYVSKKYERIVIDEFNRSIKNFSF